MVASHAMLSLPVVMSIDKIDGETCFIMQCFSDTGKSICGGAEAL